MAIDINRLLLELEKYRKETNKQVINPEVEVVNLDTLKPIVTMVAKARAAYISELLELTKNQSDDAPGIEQVESLAVKRKVFEELVEATNAFEAIIERGYADVEGLA